LSFHTLHYPLGLYDSDHTCYL